MTTLVQLLAQVRSIKSRWTIIEQQGGTVVDGTRVTADEAQTALGVVDWFEKALAGLDPFPDIGPDPLRMNPRSDLEAALERVGAAIARQQDRVPNGTALVWRYDLSRIMAENTRLTALDRLRSERARRGD